MKEIDEWPGYFVTSDGRVWSSRKKGQYLKPQIDRYGYQYVHLRRPPNISKNVKIHRLVAIAFVDGYSEDLQVNHIDGDKTNNKAANLEWVTSAENTRHAYDNRLMVAARGSKHGIAKLHEKDIPVIRKMIAAGVTQRAIAKKYNVCFQTINYLHIGKTWGHVQ